MRTAGLEPAIFGVEIRRAIHLRYAPLVAIWVNCLWERQLGCKPLAHSDTQRLGIEPRSTVLETVMLPLHYLCLVAVVGLKPT
jgi:hypothetical protein